MIDRKQLCATTGDIISRKATEGYGTLVKSS